MARHGGIPPFKETREYVKRVLERYERAHAMSAPRKGEGRLHAGGAHGRDHHHDDHDGSGHAVVALRHQERSGAGAHRPRGRDRRRHPAISAAQRGNALPPSLEVLVKGKFLRREYKDPMTKGGKWRFIRQGESINPIRAPGTPGTSSSRTSPRPTPTPTPASTVRFLSAGGHPRRDPGRGQHEQGREPPGLQRTDQVQRVVVPPRPASGRRPSEAAPAACLERRVCPGARVVHPPPRAVHARSRAGCRHPRPFPASRASPGAADRPARKGQAGGRTTAAA